MSGVSMMGPLNVIPVLFMYSASTWYAWWATSANAWLWWPMVVAILSANMSAAGHAFDYAPPRANNREFWTEGWVFEIRRRGMLWFIKQAFKLMVSGTIAEFIAAPRLFPVVVLRISFGLGYAPETWNYIMSLAHSAQASGNPALDFIGSGGALSLPEALAVASPDGKAPLSSASSDSEEDEEAKILAATAISSPFAQPVFDEEDEESETEPVPALDQMSEFSLTSAASASPTMAQLLGNTPVPVTPTPSETLSACSSTQQQLQPATLPRRRQNRSERYSMPNLQLVLNASEPLSSPGHRPNSRRWPSDLKVSTTNHNASPRAAPLSQDSDSEPEIVRRSKLPANMSTPMHTSRGLVKQPNVDVTARSTASAQSSSPNRLRSRRFSIHVQALGSRLLSPVPLLEPLSAKEVRSTIDNGQEASSFIRSRVARASSFSYAPPALHIETA